MKRLVLLLMVSLLAGCSALEGKPMPPPPATSTPQEIQRNQTQGLTKMGTVSEMVRGAPSDGERAIKQKAIAAGANYYLILLNDETIVPGQWYIQAILYRK